ncbi:MAG: hypothetical protein VBE63_17705 [Lamprobacter sp.]|uniref:hypothetical protein n=1 Tax=Lamprobacter sp. TaxID=3100796 RepID=UPI002B25F614|nr:hypothetical protein [Lamprobacter sp.]MEA3641752.1 hypothetical protein [Lamprobacter sp.]
MPLFQPASSCNHRHWKSMFLIENRGQAITKTNFWDSEQATRGILYLTWNAGAGRLLVPDNQKAMLRELKGSQEVIVSRGPWPDQGGREALELLWEDGSDSPFCIHLVTEQTDRLIPEHQQGGGFVVTVWTRGGVKGRWPGRYRVVDEIPCLKPWESH